MAQPHNTKYLSKSLCIYIYTYRENWEQINNSTLISYKIQSKLAIVMRSLQASSSYCVGICNVSYAPRHHNHRRSLTVAQVEPTEKSVEIMRKFSEQYARRSGTYFCVDKGVTSVVIKGLAEHKDSLGAPLCPCRHYDDKAAEAGQGFWNCPCVPMRERKECHCMLFLTPDNDFAGEDQTISLEEIRETTANM